MRKRHFTLIEIMIVVAIIALLALIALPNFITARRNARNTTCIANLRQIEGAKQTWSIETGAAEDVATIDANDLDGYFTGGINAIECPLGDNFTDSYDVGNLNSLATCKKDPTNHTISSQ